MTYEHNSLRSIIINTNIGAKTNKIINLVMAGIETLLMCSKEASLYFGDLILSGNIQARVSEGQQWHGVDSEQHCKYE